MSLPKYPKPIQGYDFMLNKHGAKVYRHRPTLGENADGTMSYGKISLKKTAEVPDEIKKQLDEAYGKLEEQRAVENRQAAIEAAANDASEELNDVNEFMDNELNVAEIMPAPDMTAEEQAILDSYDNEGKEQDPNAEIPADLDAAALQQENDRLRQMLKDVVAASVYEADVFTLAQQLSERFNVYTVFLQREPQTTDIHPITAEIMSSFERGLAYKQYVKSTANQTLKTFDRVVQQSFDAQATPSPIQPQNQNVQPLQGHFQPLQSHLDRDSAVTKEAAKSVGIDGVINDPPINNRRKIVDPSWLKKAKTIDQFDLEQL